MASKSDSEFFIRGNVLPESLAKELGIKEIQEDFDLGFTLEKKNGFLHSLKSFFKKITGGS